MSLSALNSFPVDGSGVNVTIKPPSSIDGFDLTGEFNSSPINYIEVDGRGVFVASNLVSSATAIRFTELIYIPIAIQTIIQFSQNEVLHNQISGQVIAFTQQTTVQVSFPIVFSEDVENITVPTFYSQHGWDISIVVNGILLDRNIIASNVVITQESNLSTLCEFKVIPPIAMNFLTLADSSPIYINYRDSSGWHRMFTGYIDEPVINLIPVFWITLKCSNRRTDLIRTTVAPLLPHIGSYCLEVQGMIAAGTTNSTAQELGYRLQTVTADLDFDIYNQPVVNSWYAKAIPDYALGDSTVFYREPKIVWQSRTAIVNSIDMVLDFNYTRNYHYQRPFEWNLLKTARDAYNQNALCQNNGSGPILRNTLPTVGDVQGAIEAAHWRDEQNTLTYETHFPLNNGPLNLLNDTWTYRTVPYGNTTYQQIVVKKPTSQAAYKILSANWEASAHFSQRVTERYELNVKSTQSINEYIIITKTASYNLTVPFDSTLWDTYTTTGAAPSNAHFSNSSYWFNNDDIPLPSTLPQILYTTGTATVNPALNFPNGRGEFANMLTTAVNKAKTEIIASHRGTSVSLQVPIMPDLNLTHTIDVDATKIQCQGKVCKIVNTIQVIDRQANLSEITVKLMKINGSAVTTATSIPAPPTDNPFESATASGYQVNHVGGYPVGTTNIAIDSGTGTLYDGNSVTFAGDNTEYTLVAPFYPLVATITIAAPGLRKALPDNTAMHLTANIGGPTYSSTIELGTHMGVDPTIAPYFLNSDGQIIPASNNGVIIHQATYDSLGNLLTPYSTSYGSVQGTPVGVQAWTGYMGNSVPFTKLYFSLTGAPFDTVNDANNSYIYTSTGIMTTYKQQFVVGTPASPPGLVGTRLLTTVANYEQALIADEFQVIV